MSAAGQENHCAKRFVGTYNGVFGNGSRSYGGHSERVRVPVHFVVKIPDALSSAAAAPMLCSGITVYALLKKNGAGSGTRVGIMGVWAAVCARAGVRAGRSDFADRGEEAGCSGDGGRCVYCDG